MLRSKDLNAEIKTLEEKIKTGKVADVDIVKVGCLIAKLLRDIRTNQVARMKNDGVKLVAPRRNEQEKPTAKDNNE